MRWWRLSLRSGDEVRDVVGGPDEAGQLIALLDRARVEALELELTWHHSEGVARGDRVGSTIRFADYRFPHGDQRAVASYDFVGDEDGSWRVYHEPQLAGKRYGFRFVALGWTGRQAPEAEPRSGTPELTWDEGTFVEVLMRGEAYSDGMRHLYLGSRASYNDGYLYYPQLDDLAGVVGALRRLEVEHCVP